MQVGARQTLQQVKQLAGACVPQANGFVVGSAGEEGTVGAERHTPNGVFVACGCSDNYGISTVEREGAVALVKKGCGVRNFRFLDLLARLSLISCDSTVNVTVGALAGL